jgi:hypothetical protein
MIWVNRNPAKRYRLLTQPHIVVSCYKLPAAFSDPALRTHLEDAPPSPKPIQFYHVDIIKFDLWPELEEAEG